MRKTHKRILGFLSLGLVAAMTIFAATLPIPGAKAATTASVTDVIRVTVVGSQVKIDIVDPSESGYVYAHPLRSISVDQDNAISVTIRGVYTDEDGNDHPFNIGSYNPTEVHDINTITINLNDYGYGTYTITAEGEDAAGTTDEDVTTFNYVPTKADVDDSDEDGDVYVDLDYEVGVVCSADVNIFLGGNKVTPPSPIHVEAPTTRVQIPVDDLETGDYTVITTAYDCPAPGEDPEPLPFPYTDSFHHDKEDIPVPDTGGLFMGLNISKTDYLLTAIIVFFAFAILALFIVLKGKKNNKRR